jgi:hypothetical protein
VAELIYPILILVTLAYAHEAADLDTMLLASPYERGWPKSSLKACKCELKVTFKGSVVPEHCKMNLLST